MSEKRPATVLENWQCPHCLVWSLVTEREYTTTHVGINAGNAQHMNDLTVRSFLCRNSSCKRVTIFADLFGMIPHRFPSGSGSKLGLMRSFRLEPASKAKPQPPYIPSPIIADYQEAYLISELSPKASATLSRRCLQGMIRDFFGISKKTLGQEITAIKEMIDADMWGAIDSVRKIGNIGAHMEKDINVIVEVDEHEAQLLLALIEQLFDDWYVTRQKRQERLQAIKDAALEMDRERKGAPPEAEPSGT